MKKLLGRVARQSPALIVAMLALLVALTGTAVATTSALIGSAQIRNNSITGLDVKNRSLRPIDFRGSVRGSRGLRGLTGPQGSQGAQGVQGPAGPFPDGDMPGGKTVRGTYALGAKGATVNSWTQISFGFTMATAPVGHMILSGAAPNASCPGTVANPQAAPGHLCVYEAVRTNMSDGFPVVFDPSSPSDSSPTRWGAGIWGQSGAGTSESWSYGTWAATSPAGAAAAATAESATRSTGS